MSLSDIVAGSGLAFFAEVALLIFLCVFVVVGTRALLTRRSDFDRIAQLPFDDGERDPAVTPSSAHTSAN